MKNYIFDLDGTLADTLPLCIEAFKVAIKNLTGKELTEKEITAHFGKSEEGIIKELYPENIELGVKEYAKTYQNLHHLCPTVFDGIIEILDELKRQNCSISMVTGKGPQTCPVSLEYYGIKKYFEVIKTGSPEKNVKEIRINEVIKELGYDKSETVYIGDTPTDIIDSKNVGINVYSALWKPKLEDEDKIIALKPNKIFYNTKDFIELIKK